MNLGLFHCFSRSIFYGVKILARLIPRNSRIVSVKNYSNFIFFQFRVFVYGPVPENDNAEFAESLKKFHLLCQ